MVCNKPMPSPKLYLPRLKVQLVSVFATVVIPTLLAIVAIPELITSNTSVVVLADILTPRCEDVCAIFLRFPLIFLLLVNWSEKAKRRRTVGTGRCRYLKNAIRRARNGHRDGKTPVAAKKSTTA